MKKVLVILAVLAVTGIASTEMITNPQDFESEALGFVGQGNPIPGWEGYGQGSGASGWQSTWTGGQVTPSVVDMGGNKALLVDNAAGLTGWAFNLAFAHDNDLSTLDAGTNAPGFLTLSFDLLAAAQVPIIKIEHYALFGDHPNQGAIRVDAWDNPGYESGEGAPVAPGWLPAGSHSFTVSIPAGANYVTPVLGNSGVGGYSIYDNIELTANPVPEPATLALLGLGGLLLRRRK